MQKRIAGLKLCIVIINFAFFQTTYSMDCVASKYGKSCYFELDTRYCNELLRKIISNTNTPDSIIAHNLDIELMESQINEKNAKKTNKNGETLWHLLAKYTSLYSEGFEAKANFLYTLIPNTINLPNNRGKTALDLLVESLDIGCIKHKNEIILILRSYNAKTSKELENENLECLSTFPIQ